MKKFEIEGLFTWRDRKPKNVYAFELNWGSKYIILDMSEYTNFLSSLFFSVSFLIQLKIYIELTYKAFENNDMKYNKIIPTKILESQKYVYK